MNARDYPDRIHANVDPEPTLATLRALVEVAPPDGGFGIPFVHMALEVDIDGSPWLADVGFGDGFLYPIPVVENAEGDYRLTRDSNDCADACRHHQCSGDSMFTQCVVSTRATPGGRITFTPERLIRHRGIPSEPTETPIAHDTEWRYALEEHFDFVPEEVSCTSDDS